MAGIREMRKAAAPKGIADAATQLINAAVRQIRPRPAAGLGAPAAAVHGLHAPPPITAAFTRPPLGAPLPTLRSARPPLGSSPAPGLTGVPPSGPVGNSSPTPPGGFTGGWLGGHAPPTGPRPGALSPETRRVLGLSALGGLGVAGVGTGIEGARRGWFSPDQMRAPSAPSGARPVPDPNPSGPPPPTNSPDVSLTEQAERLYRNVFQGGAGNPDPHPVNDPPPPPLPTGAPDPNIKDPAVNEPSLMEKLKPYIPYIAGGALGVGGLAALHHLLSNKDDDEDEDEKQASHKSPFVQGFLAKCAEARYSQAEIDRLIQRVSKLAPEIENELSAR